MSQTAAFNGTTTRVKGVATEAHAGTIGIGTKTSSRRPRSRRLQMIRQRARARRRERAVRAHGIRAGSPPGPADRMYFLPPKAY
jgi:hypothetical protein